MRLVIITINLNSESQLKARHGSTVTINIFINDLEKGTHVELSKFADDTKLFQVVKCQADGDKLQGELASLHEWADKW